MTKGKIESSFAELGLAPTASPDEIRQAYRELMMVWHPDRFSHNSGLKAKAEVKTAQLNEAYELIQEALRSGWKPSRSGQSGVSATTRSGPDEEHFARDTARTSPPPPAAERQFKSETERELHGVLSGSISDSSAIDRQLRWSESRARTAKHVVRGAQARLAVESLQLSTGEIRRKIRLTTQSLKIPSWGAALALGSVSAFFLAMVAIYFTSGGPQLLVGSIVVGYGLFGGTTQWFLQEREDEWQIKKLIARQQLAKEKLEHAKEAFAALDATTIKLRLLWKLRQSSPSSSAGSLAQAGLQEAAQRAREASRLLSIDPGRLYPDEFEEYVAQIFRHLGYSVHITGRSGDQGVDLIAENRSIRLAVQAKRHIGSVGNSAVQEVFAGMAHHQCHRCIVVTTARFTNGAVELARSTGCILIEMNDIPRLIQGQLEI